MEKRGAGCTLAVRITVDGVKCFGPGMYELLSGVEREHSLRSAAMAMGMAYSKAWRIVGESERALGFALLSKKTGGVNGGGAALTKEAMALMEAYQAFVAEVNGAAEAALKKNFGGLI